MQDIGFEVIVHSASLTVRRGLTFVLDQGVKRSIAVAKILREVLPAETPEESEEEAAGEIAEDLPSSGAPADDSPPQPGTA
jgi:hypothetical protein